MVDRKRERDRARDRDRRAKRTSKGSTSAPAPNVGGKDPRSFGLPEPAPEEARLVKRADGIAAYWEAVRLAGFDRGEAAAVFGEPGPLGPEAEILLESWPTDRAQARFLARFHDLATET